MILSTEINDVLSDGTITEILFTVPLTISLIVKRSYPNEPFSIIKCDVQGMDEKELSNAIGMIMSKIKEMDINLLVPVASTQRNPPFDYRPRPEKNVRAEFSILCRSCI